MFDLTGKTALVTGATGGIGGEIAKALHAAGATVVLSGTREAVLQDLARAGLEMVDTENLRPHYARTLWAWSDGLEARLRAARGVLAAQAGAEQADKVLRAYRLYLAGSALGFERGWMALHQMLAIKPDGDTARGLLPGAQ